MKKRGKKLEQPGHIDHSKALILIEFKAQLLQVEKRKEEVATTKAKKKLEAEAKKAEREVLN